MLFLFLNLSKALTYLSFSHLPVEDRKAREGPFAESANETPKKVLSLLLGFIFLI